MLILLRVNFLKMKQIFILLILTFSLIANSNAQDKSFQETFEKETSNNDFKGLKNQFQNIIQQDTFLIGKSHSISSIKKIIIPTTHHLKNLESFLKMV